MLASPARRASALPFLLLPVLGACGSRETTPFDGERAMAHVMAMQEFGPRPAGSPALAKTADYIRKELTDLGLAPQTQRWREEEHALDLQNVWVQIDGTDPKDGPIIVIGAHYDTKNCQGHPDPEHNFRFMGAIDGTGGPAVLLELARILKDRKQLLPKDQPARNLPNIWLVWFDAEENLEFEWTDESKALFGSRHFVSTMAADKERFPQGLNKRMKAMILIDLVGAKNPKIDKDTSSESELLEIFADAGRRMGESARMFQTSSSITDDHKAFRNYGVPSINLIDFHFRIPQERARPGEKAATDSRYEAWWHTERDTPDKMSPFGLKFFGDLVLLGLPAVEAQYVGKG